MIDDLKKLIKKHWGFATFRPLQEDAMRAVLDGRDSLLVLPTGGGKSLCFQAPAVLRGGTTVVISPLIALMKDQVDGLQACGVPAVQLDSSLSGAERFAYEQDVRDGAVRLLFVSPERLMMTEFCNLCRQIDVKTFAIDEAHCISHWGHDFRPEYRMLSRIKELFPGVSVHGYTATATEQVRADICKELALKNPLVLVGNFDRPNLTYRVLRRNDVERQVREVLDRHKGEAGIIYCLSKKNVDETNALVQGWGFKSHAYHAGKTTEERTRVQELFINEECDVIVATVAFGMGIDRSNLRFVLHTSMPKSVEHYQQETGRAGRDGLEAECVLLHSGQDFLTWKSILQKSAQENEVGPDFLPNALKHAEDLDRYARGAVCRHKALVSYFGQDYAEPNCGACDLCLGDVEVVADADGVVIAQKILSCVARVKERFGVNHVISVLRGEDNERVRQYQHNQLSTYAIMKDYPKNVVRDWIFQLIGQGVLAKSEDEYPVLKLNLASWKVMKAEQKVQLVQPVRKQKSEKVKQSRADEISWEDVDRGLFESLRQWRFERAKLAGKPPYIIFSDATLRELSRVRPSTLPNLLLVYGIGSKKIEQFGDALLQALKEYCANQNLSMDNEAAPVEAPTPVRAKTMTASLSRAIELFREGAAIEDVMHQTGRARPTVVDYLCEFIRADKPASVENWVGAELFERIAAVVAEHGSGKLKPLFIALEEKVSYDDIRVVVAHLSKDQ